YIPQHFKTLSIEQLIAVLRRSWRGVSTTGWTYNFLPDIMSHTTKCDTLLTAGPSSVTHNSLLVHQGYIPQHFKTLSIEQLIAPCCAALGGVSRQLAGHITSYLTLSHTTKCYIPQHFKTLSIEQLIAVLHRSWRVSRQLAGHITSYLTLCLTRRSVTHNSLLVHQGYIPQHFKTLSIEQLIAVLRRSWRGVSTTGWTYNFLPDIMSHTTV
ncbi:hypothetical protein J6590_106202, partial [Homalodisca vitripennis]